MRRLGQTVIASKSRGFTLVELIVLMALMAFVATMVAPSLAAFMSGRAASEECRRLLAATRYARSEAVSRGCVIEFWIEPENGRYGVRPASLYEEDDAPAVEFEANSKLRFEATEDNLDANGAATIAFRPDGNIETESLQEIRIVEEGRGALVLAPADDALRYEIREEGDER